ncbi:MAG: universal stress protein [Desulfobacterales bacterium]|nr:universal stress protein [Desulfobacterales bacterium]
MKILVAVDEQPYSAVAAREAARLAVNTWADVTILGIQSGNATAPDRNLGAAVCRYQQAFLGGKDGPASPYGNGECATTWSRTAAGAWEAAVDHQTRKSLRLCIRAGDPLETILDQGHAEGSDFIIIGAGPGNEPGWTGTIELPARVANLASCSVLVVKEEKKVNTVVCFLDHTHVSQESLEIINQLVTLHQAELKIVGLAAAKGLKEGVEAKMGEVLKYYAARGIKAWITLVEATEMEEFAARKAPKNLVGLWLGKKSFITKLFSKDRVSQLIHATGSSVLILK